MSWLASLVVTGGLGLLLLAGFVVFRRHGGSFAESLSLSIVTTMAVLSCELQVFFLLGRPALALAFELLLVAAAVAMLRRERGILSSAWRHLAAFFRIHPLLASVIGVAWAYLFALAWLIPPDNADALRYHLPRVLLFEQAGSPLLDVTTTHQAHRAVFPVGSDVLSFLWLRNDSDYGVATLSFLSYLAIVFGTYAVARRYAAPPVSLATSAMTLSLSGLVYQATAAKNDIVMAAAGVYCVVLAQRLHERIRAVDLALLLLGLSFGFSTKMLFWGFAGPFVLVFGVLLLRRHGLGTWRRVVVEKRWVFLALLLPMTILSQIWLLTYNRLTSGGWAGPPEFTASSRNHDGWWGATANLVRYAHEVPDFLKVGDRLAYHLTGHQLSKVPQRTYDRVFADIFQKAGTSSRFQVSWSMNESKSWFGPLGFLIFIPAAFWALLRGPPVLRGLSLVLLAYVILVAWQVEWMQWNGRFFTICFACSGGFAAWWLPRWTARPLEVISIVLLYVACGFNQTKPLLPLVSQPGPFVRGALQENIWVTTNWGRDRFYFYGDVRGLETFARILPRNARVGVVTHDVASFYHYMMRRPDIELVPLPRESPEANLDALLCIGVDECGWPTTCHAVDGRWNDYCLSYPLAASVVAGEKIRDDGPAKFASLDGLEAMIEGCEHVVDERCISKFQTLEYHVLERIVSKNREPARAWPSGTVDEEHQIVRRPGTVLEKRPIVAVRRHDRAGHRHRHDEGIAGDRFFGIHQRREPVPEGVRSQVIEKSTQGGELREVLGIVRLATMPSESTIPRLYELRCRRQVAPLRPLRAELAVVARVEDVLDKTPAVAA